MRTVKCKYCGNKISTSVAYKYNNGKNNVYFCNEQEYTSFLKKEEEKKQNKLLHEKIKKEQEIVSEVKSIINDIIGTDNYGSITRTINDLLLLYSIYDIHSYLLDKKDYIYFALKRKNIEKEKNRFKYVMAIINSHIDEYIEEKHNEENIVPIEIDFELLPIKYKNIYKRIALVDIENEVEEETV